MTYFKLKLEILKAQIDWASGGFALCSLTRALPWTHSGCLQCPLDPPAAFSMLLSWEKVFGLLETQFRTQKQFYDKVLGKTSADNKLSSIQFEDNDIIKIIRSLDTCKAHGHYVFIRMLKLCDLATVKPLSIIFSSCVNQSTFTDIWKKLNKCPIHRKGYKQVINNYRPVSAEPRVYFGILFTHVTGNLD